MGDDGLKNAIILSGLSSNKITRDLRIAVLPGKELEAFTNGEISKKLYSSQWLLHPFRKTNAGIE
jgi:hypothetical protein